MNILLSKKICRTLNVTYKLPQKMAYGHVEDFKLFYAIFKNCYNQFYNLKILNLQNSITHNCPSLPIRVL